MRKRRICFLIAIVKYRRFSLTYKSKFGPDIPRHLNKVGLIFIEKVSDWQGKLLFERKRGPESEPNHNHILFIDLFTALVNVKTIIYVCQKINIYQSKSKKKKKKSLDCFIIFVMI